MILLLHNVQLPENLGAVARIMVNFGLTELRLITPKADPLDLKAIATAAGAEDILYRAHCFQTLEDAASDLSVLFGTCGDKRVGIRHYISPKALFEKMQKEDIGPMGVLFGCERTGLSQDMLSHCKATLHIPVNPDFSSMNLSHAVAIVAYEAFQLRMKPSSITTNLGKTKFATYTQKDYFFKVLIEKLDRVDYWRVTDKKPLMAQNLANLFFRMDLTEQEIQTLLGMFQALSKSRQLD